MNSQEFRTAARTTFALAMDAYYAVSNDNNATMDDLIAADVAKTAADAQWIADQHTANQMAQAELDAATAKGCEEVVEVVATPTAAQNAALDALYDAVTANEGYAHLVAKAEGLGVDRCIIGKVIAKAEKDSLNPIVTAPTAAEVVATINTNEAFGVAWGADGQVLSYAETVEAIAAGRGWFDRQGRWVNRAGWERKIDATIASK
jgi:hypothetical protein